jgi:hypothetical protein
MKTALLRLASVLFTIFAVSFFLTLWVLLYYGDLF